MARVVPLRRPWLWLASAGVGVLLAALAVSVFRNPNIQHGVESGAVKSATINGGANAKI